MSDVEQVCNVMLAYIQNSLEASHALFAGLPICPFVRVARMNHRLELWVYPFQVSDEIETEIYQKIEEFSTLNHQKDVLLVIHPDPCAINFATFNRFIEALNKQICALGLVVFGGHPNDLFEVNGVRTRHDPFINFTVQRIQKLSDARRSLIHNSDYYTAWDAEALNAVGIELVAL